MSERYVEKGEPLDIARESAKYLLGRYQKGELENLDERELEQLLKKFEEFAKEGTTSLHEQARQAAEEIKKKLADLRKKKPQGS